MSENVYSISVGDAYTGAGRGSDGDRGVVSEWEFVWAVGLIQRRGVQQVQYLCNEYHAVHKRGDNNAVADSSTADAGAMEQGRRGRA